MGWLTPPIYKPGDAEAALTAQILAGDKSSRLYKSLVYQQQIAQDVNIQQQSELLGSIFELTATARPGHSAAQIEKAVDAELSRFRSEGPDQKEVDRARNTIETNFIRALERLGGFGGVADRLNQYNHYLGDPSYVERDIQRYRDATPGSIRLVDSKQDVARTTTLLIFKAFIVPGDSGIFMVQANDFKGFQYGDPSKHPKRITVSLYSVDGGIEFSFARKDMQPLAISQAEINRVVQTLRYNGLAETAQK